MQSKREYLVGLGLAKPGRGRFSAEGKAAIAAAEAAGTVFTDGGKVASDSPESEPRAPRSVTTKDEGQAFTFKPEPTNTTPVQTYLPPFNVSPKVRTVGQILGVDDRGTKIAFANCARCTSHVDFCRCKSGPKPPAYIVSVVG
jgi:hypothetical protein